MSETQRLRIGVVGVVAGSLLLVAGIVAAHFTGLPELDSVGREIYPSIPRCAWFESGSKCWVLPISSQIIAVIGSQILMAAIVFGWIYERTLTWAKATVGAFIFTLEMIILFGIIPNEWLGLTQGTFEWTRQKIAFSLPKWLALNNDVGISYGVVKDAVAGGYVSIVLGGIAVGAYRWQERPAEKPAKPLTLSTYGRPLIKGGR